MINFKIIYNTYGAFLRSVHVKYKIFLSAMEYLPFSTVDDSKGSFEDIIERYLLVFCLELIEEK